MKRVLHFTVITIILAVFLCTGVSPHAQSPQVKTGTLDDLVKYKDCRSMFIGGSEALLKLVKEANEEGIRAILLSQANGTKENVGYLQEHLLEVWVEEAGPQHALEPYYSILSGADGIITDRPEDVQSALNEILEWTKDSTLLLRSPLIIGYGGVPSIAPMDSLEGLNSAISNHVTVTETGVFFTKDGVPIAAHQDSLLELTGHDVNISELTEDEVTTYRIIAGNTTEHQHCFVTRFKDLLSAIRGTNNVLYASLSTDDEQLISFCYELVQDLELDSQVIFIPSGDIHSTISVSQGPATAQGSDPMDKILAGEQLIFLENALDFTDLVCKLTPQATELSINTKAVISTQAQATLSTVSGETVSGKISFQILNGADCLSLSEDGTKISGSEYGTASILYKYTGIIPGTNKTYTLYSQPFTININSNMRERIILFSSIAIGITVLIVVTILIIKRPRTPKFKPVPMSKD